MLIFLTCSDNCVINEMFSLEFAADFGELDQACLHGQS